MEASFPVFAFFINGENSQERCRRMQDTLSVHQDVLPFERWPATQGGPVLLQSHARVMSRGVEPHLYPRRCQQRLSVCSPLNISGWGMVGNYLSHLGLLEEIGRRFKPGESVLILQDDVSLEENWIKALHGVVARVPANFSRVLLAWFGAERPADCDDHLCAVLPPAGPDTSGRRFYHGLQASIVRAGSVGCLLHCLSRRQIKSIDALLVNCAAGCPGAWAVRQSATLGKHNSGSERVALDAALRASGTRPTLRTPRKAAAGHRDRTGAGSSFTHERRKPNAP